MATTAAERQRRHRHHRRGDHSLCNPTYCARPLAGTPARARERRFIEGPQALYRFFDLADVLLYVGITADLPQRFKAHRDEKPWWTEVSRITVDHYPDRAAVEQAEREAIAAERPRWNVVHNDGTPPPPARPTSSALTVSYGGVEVRLESAEPAEELATAALRIAVGLRSEACG